MTHAYFTDDSYELFDSNDQPCFNDNNHLYLFDYLAKDISRIESLIKAFFTEQFDFVRLQLRKDRPPIEYREDLERDKQLYNIVVIGDYAIDNTYLMEIKRIIERSHPYYQIQGNALEVTEDVLIDYFHTQASQNEDFMKMDEYEDILTELLSIPPFLPIGMRNLLLRDNMLKLKLKYKDYTNKYNDYREIRRMLSIGKEVEAILPKIIDEQINIQRIVSNFFDIQGDDSRSEYSFNVDLNYSVFVNSHTIREKLNIDNLNQLLQCELIRMIKAGIRAKRCHCCNNYFIYDDNRKNYCNRIIEGDKTCQDVGPGRYFRSRKKTDDLYQAYRKALSKNKMRQSRKQLSAQELEFWQKAADAKRKSNSEDLAEWLDLAAKDIRDAYHRNNDHDDAPVIVHPMISTSFDKH